MRLLVVASRFGCYCVPPLAQPTQFRGLLADIPGFTLYLGNVQGAALDTGEIHCMEGRRACV
jgi:hypothetical protein